MVAAFLAFAEEGVEVAVVECGLGGRLDATATCEPFATVVTRIGMDHAEVLGPTPERIAFEKAGIARAGVPLVVGPLDPGPRAWSGSRPTCASTAPTTPMAPRRWRARSPANPG